MMRRLGQAAIQVEALDRDLLALQATFWTLLIADLRSIEEADYG